MLSSFSSTSVTSTVEMISFTTGTDVFSFIGISEDTTITYMDIDIGSIHVFPETFVVYEYDSFRGRFTKVSDISANSSGSYVINKNGKYKLTSYHVGGSND